MVPQDKMPLEEEYILQKKLDISQMLNYNLQ